jgi:hypothetical protein
MDWVFATLTKCPSNSNSHRTSFQRQPEAANTCQWSGKLEAQQRPDRPIGATLHEGSRDWQVAESQAQTLDLDRDE